MIEEIKLSIDNLSQKLEGTPEWSLPHYWKNRLKDIGISGLDSPADYGGSGLSLAKMVDIFAHCGQINLDLRDLPGAGHGRILLYPSKVISRNIKEILRKVILSDAFVAVAITEDMIGSDIRNMTTRAYRQDNGYLITGEKLYVARLKQASHVIVFAMTDNQHISPFIIPIPNDHIEISSLNSLGLQGVSFGGIRFDEVFVHEDLRIGKEEEGLDIFKKHFTYWRIAMSAAAIGCARGALKQAIHWLQNRQAFGGSIGRFTHLQQELASHFAHLHMAWLLCLSTAEKLDQGLSAYTDAAMLKAEAIEIALAATDWSMRVHGAKGYTDQIDIEKRFRDLLGLRVADGATDMLRGQVAREILGESLYRLSLGRNPSSFKLNSSKNSGD